jgi:hypothetical protein
MTGPALATCLLLAWGHLRYQFALRTQTRSLPDGAGDLQLDPLLAVETPPRSMQLNARYFPTMLLREPRPRGTVNLLHRGILSGTLSLSKDRRLLAEQRFAHGPTDLSWLALPPDVAPPILIRSFRSQLVGTLDSSSSISFEQAIRQRLRFGLTARYSVSGGLSNEDQLIMPRFQSVELGASGEFSARRETFTVVVTGSRGWISTGHRTALLGANTGWRHLFGRRFEGELSAGLSLLGGDPEERHGAVPTAAITVRRELPRDRRAVGGWITLRWGPVLDRSTGALLRRAEGAARLDFAPLTALLLSASGGVAVTPDVAPPGARVLAQGAVGIAHKLTHAFTISAGVRLVTLPTLEWAALITTTLSEKGSFALR